MKISPYILYFFLLTTSINAQEIVVTVSDHMEVAIDNINLALIKNTTIYEGTQPSYSRASTSVDIKDDAWVVQFLKENDIEYIAHPEVAASFHSGPGGSSTNMRQNYELRNLNKKQVSVLKDFEKQPTNISFPNSATVSILNESKVVPELYEKIIKKAKLEVDRLAIALKKNVGEIEKIELIQLNNPIIDWRRIDFDKHQITSTLQLTYATN